MADARLAELIAAVESGRQPEPAISRSGPAVADLAARWQEANKPRRDRNGRSTGWSPKTAKTVPDNFRSHLLPELGGRRAASVSAVLLDHLYAHMQDDLELSPSVVVRCHGQLRAMFNWAMRKKLEAVNPALAADPPRVRSRALAIPDMAQVRAVQGVGDHKFRGVHSTGRDGGGQAGDGEVAVEFGRARRTRVPTG